ncbi:conserved domain protein [Streptococcus oralis SK255]|uniref:Conserved domain protein n=1 Tax=Streptococcus oralis SK255 TaxID=1005704 RepID=F5VU25_STROR|nr:conserved domain protein [Streptococcus oralis SK255]
MFHIKTLTLSFINFSENGLYIETEFNIDGLEPLWLLPSFKSISQRFSILLLIKESVVATLEKSHPIRIYL